MEWCVNEDCGHCSALYKGNCYNHLGKDTCDKFISHKKDKAPVFVPLSDRVMPADCDWQTDVGYFGDDRYYATACDETFFFSEGTPKENNFVYCPYCGGKIKQA
jgi:hypothetical protein